MMKAAASLLFIAATAVSSFQVTSPVLVRSSISTNGPTTTSPLYASSETTVSTAQEILDDFHSSNLPFRIVVIGNGAILETTSKLGHSSDESAEWFDGMNERYGNEVNL
eukprot:scaffold8097_cov148-Skeletonema_menzelii.AAC.13